jgi:hypothetical protein
MGPNWAPAHASIHDLTKLLGGTGGAHLLVLFTAPLSAGHAWHAQYACFVSTMWHHMSTHHSWAHSTACFRLCACIMCIPTTALARPACAASCSCAAPDPGFSLYFWLYVPALVRQLLGRTLPAAALNVTILRTAPTIFPVVATIRTWWQKIFPEATQSPLDARNHSTDIVVAMCNESVLGKFSLGGKFSTPLTPVQGFSPPHAPGVAQPACTPAAPAGE